MVNTRQAARAAASAATITAEVPQEAARSNIKVEAPVKQITSNQVELTSPYAKNGGVKKRCAGKNALRYIGFYQKSAHRFIPRRSFLSLVKEISREIDPEIRWQVSAMKALHEAAEIYLGLMFEDAQLLAIHAKKMAVLRQDMQLARRLRGTEGLY